VKFRTGARHSRGFYFMAINLQVALDTLINKFHIILATVAQAAVLAYHFKTGHDIGPGVQNTLYAYYAFLAGHAGIYQKWPDPTSTNQQQ
jgi:hypothetical protein